MERLSTLTHSMPLLFQPRSLPNVPSELDPLPELTDDDNQTKAQKLNDWSNRNIQRLYSADNVLEQLKVAAEDSLQIFNLGLSSGHPTTGGNMFDVLAKIAHVNCVHKANDLFMRTKLIIESAKLAADQMSLLVKEFGKTKKHGDHTTEAQIAELFSNFSLIHQQLAKREDGYFFVNLGGGRTAKTQAALEAHQTAVWTHLYPQVTLVRNQLFVEEPRPDSVKATITSTPDVGSSSSVPIVPAFGATPNDLDDATFERPGSHDPLSPPPSPISAAKSPVVISSSGAVVAGGLSQTEGDGEKKKKK